VCANQVELVGLDSPQGFYGKAGLDETGFDEVSPVLDLLQLALDDADQSGKVRRHPQPGLVPGDETWPVPVPGTPPRPRGTRYGVGSWGEIGARPGPFIYRYTAGRLHTTESLG